MSNWILITPIITFQFGGPEVSKFDLNFDDLDRLRGSYRHRHVESLFSSYYSQRYFINLIVLMEVSFSSRLKSSTIPHKITLYLQSPSTLQVL